VTANTVDSKSITNRVPIYAASGFSVGTPKG
jgi:hypothetical protein